MLSSVLLRSVHLRVKLREGVCIWCYVGAEAADGLSCGVVGADRRPTCVIGHSSGRLLALYQLLFFFKTYGNEFPGDQLVPLLVLYTLPYGSGR